MGVTANNGNVLLWTSLWNIKLLKFVDSVMLYKKYQLLNQNIDCLPLLINFILFIIQDNTLVIS